MGQVGVFTTYTPLYSFVHINYTLYEVTKVYEPPSSNSSRFSLGFTPLSGSPASSVVDNHEQSILFPKTTQSSTLWISSSDQIKLSTEKSATSFDDTYPWDIRYGSSVIESLSRNFELDKSISFPVLESIGENLTTCDSFTTLNDKANKVVKAIQCSHPCTSNTSSVTT